MNPFEKAVSSGVSTSMKVMGEDFHIGGTTIKGVLDELEMDSERESFGNKEEVTAELVFESLPVPPRQGLKLIRASTGDTFEVLTFNTSTGHITLSVRMLGKRSNA
jgi:hypothetical protein